MVILPATEADLQAVIELVAQGRAALARQGVDQWQDGYPAPGHISADIGRNRGYVLCKPGVEGPLSVIAYGAVVFDGEPAYDAIDGQWLTDEPYVLRGVAAALLREAAREALVRGIRSFRIDTHPDNGPMRALLVREGFACRGKVRYEAVRLAYEKPILG